MADGDEDGRGAEGYEGVFRDGDDQHGDDQHGDDQHGDDLTLIDPGDAFNEPVTPSPSPGPVVGGPAGAPPPPPPGPAVAGYPVPVIMVAPPAATTTVLITLFFGLFGLIPASRHAQRAQQMGLDGSKYWKAFGITFGAMTAASVLVVVLLPILGVGLFAALLGTAGGSYSSPTGYQPSSYTQPTSSSPPTSYDQPTYSDQPSAPPVGNPTYGSTDSASDTGDHPALAGTWVAVLDSFAQNSSSISEARSLASRLSTNYGVQVSVVDSGSYPGLNSGYWAVVLTGFSSNEQARAACSTVGRQPSDACYGRHITG